MREQIIQRVPNSILVRVNRHPALKRILRRGLSGQAAPAGSFRDVELSTGPAAGLSMRLDMGTDERRIWQGTYEPWIHSVLPHVLSDGVNCWDIGAHVGYYVLCAVALSPSGHHVAVEADPGNVVRLNEHLARNAVGNVSVRDVAVAARAGTVRFAAMEDGIISRISEEGGTPVDAVTMDSLLDDCPSPNLVMMDIEGGEAEALAGAELLLTSARPMWLMELHGDPGLVAHDILVGHGYTPEYAVPDVPVRDQLAYQRVHALFRP